VLSLAVPADDPDALTSKQYARDVPEVASLGRKDSTTRTAVQTETAMFWSEHTAQRWSRALVRLASDRQLSLSEAARTGRHNACRGASAAGPSGRTPRASSPCRPPARWSSRRQGDAWLYIDPAGPTCALSAGEIDFALRNPRNEPLKEALAALHAGKTDRHDVVSVLRQDGPLLLALTTDPCPGKWQCARRRCLTAHRRCSASPVPPRSSLSIRRMRWLR
jgi:hypothetical protein